ncbi:MAG: T9SS type A sorting domain-containing protein [Bacteroidales bacterium]|nr:T9SS type A sorting domain-containing protein [Bacteroidales bacterium]
MKNQAFFLFAVCSIAISTIGQNNPQKFDPVIILEPLDSLDCANYNFETWQWQPYQIEAEVQNADVIEWTTSGDGTFDNENIAAPIYYIGKNDHLNNAVTLTITATGNGLTETANIALGIPLQLIPITKDGWTGLSSFVEKSDVSVTEVMAPVVEHLTIMMNSEGSYYWPIPIPPINNIGNWSAVGYEAKFFDPPACLPVYGNPVADQSVFADGTFIYLPVLTNYPVAIEDLLGENAEKVLIIYDWKDSLTWTPSSPGFEYLNPGMAYNMILNVGESFTVQFPPYSWEDPQSIKVNTATEIEVFPNPSNGIFSVKLSDIFQSVEFEIFNMSGVPIKKGHAKQSSIINISTYPKGVYYLKISFNGTKLLKKVIVY